MSLEDSSEFEPDPLHNFRKRYGGGYLENDEGQTPFDKDSDLLQAQKYREMLEYQRTGIRPPKATPDT